MNISKFVLGVALFVVCLAFSSSFVMADAKAKGKPAPPVVGHGSKGHGSEELGDMDLHHALEELKVLTSAVTKRTKDNKNILVGSAITNAILLTIVTALVGYSLKDSNKNKKNNGDPQDEQNAS